MGRVGDSKRILVNIILNLSTERKASGASTVTGTQLCS